MQEVPHPTLHAHAYRRIERTMKLTIILIKLNYRRNVRNTKKTLHFLAFLHTIAIFLAVSSHFVDFIFLFRFDFIILLKKKILPPI